MLRTLSHNALSMKRYPKTRTGKHRQVVRTVANRYRLCQGDPFSVSCLAQKLSFTPGIDDGSGYDTRHPPIDHLQCVGIDIVYIELPGEMLTDILKTAGYHGCFVTEVL